MWKAFSALGGVALLAGLLAVLSATSDQVEASTPAALAKGDRLDTRPIGADCSKRGWPYFEASCVRNRTAKAGPTKVVRIVTSDRTSSFTSPTDRQR